MKAQDSWDRATIQQFIDKYMTWARVDGELAMRNQTGGFEVKRVEESNDTHLVVLAQERGPLKQFVRIGIDVGSAEPYPIVGLRIQPTQPPADLAPPKMTESEIAAA